MRQPNSSDLLDLIIDHTSSTQHLESCWESMQAGAFYAYEIFNPESTASMTMNNTAAKRLVDAVVDQALVWLKLGQAQSITAAMNLLVVEKGLGRTVFNSGVRGVQAKMMEQ
jgi:hypothetical protein